MASAIRDAVAGSSDAVGSSSSRIGAGLSRARARATRWRSPALRVRPSWPSGVSQARRQMGHEAVESDGRGDPSRARRRWRPGAPSRRFSASVAVKR